MDLENMSSAELYHLYSKKKLEEEKNDVPKVILEGNSLSTLELISLAESYMEDSINGREIDSHYAYELLMQIVYGRDVFTYINSLN